MQVVCMLNINSKAYMRNKASGNIIGSFNTRNAFVDFGPAELQCLFLKRHIT
jgi:hypothetical protein